MLFQVSVLLNLPIYFGFYSFAFYFLRDILTLLIEITLSIYSYWHFKNQLKMKKKLSLIRDTKSRKAHWSNLISMSIITCFLASQVHLVIFTVGISDSEFDLVAFSYFNATFKYGLDFFIFFYFNKKFNFFFKAQ